MFWPFYTFPQLIPFFLHQNLQIEASTSDPAPKNQQIKENQIRIKQNNSEGKKWIDLNREDLIQISYGNVKNHWSQQQDKLLQKLMKKYQTDWQLISQQMPGRNAKMCYSRYRRLQSRTKDSWKKQEEAIIMEYAQSTDYNWKLISQKLISKDIIIEERTAKQIKEHYMNYLRPGINKGIWNIQDDILLIQLLNQYGTNWKKVQQNMNGRTESQIKNRYFGKLTKLIDKKLKVSQQNISQLPLQNQI